MSTRIVRGAGGDGGGGGGHTPTEAPDSLRSRQYARILDCISEGEIEGLANGAQSIYLDDTPLVNPDGSRNFSGATWTVRTGTQAQGYIPGFAAVESDHVVASEIKASAPVVRTITNPNVDAVRVTVSVPQLTDQDQSTGDINGTSVEIAIDVQTAGSGWVPVKMRLVPVNLSVDGAFASSGTIALIRADISVKWTGQSDLSFGFIQQATCALEYRRLPDGAWTQFATKSLSGSCRIEHVYRNREWERIIHPPTDVASVVVDLPEEAPYELRALLLSGTGTLSFEPTSQPQTGGHAIGYTWSGSDVIIGKTTSRYQRSYRVDLTGPGPWDIRVRRITPDSTKSNLQNKTFWDSYTEIIDAKLRYPNSALVALQVDAQQFRAIPRRGYDIKGLRVRVPANYDTATRTYSGVWDGTFKIAWTDNPAWCFYDLLTNDRYGLGQFIDAAQVDKWALYQIAQYCDELVPDGFGGMEPRFTCNLYLQTRQEAFTVLSQMASIFRSMVWWSQGALTAVQDAPSDPVALFTSANVIDGAFQYSGSSAKQRHTVALVAWNDPADLYRQKIEYVEDVDGIARYGVQETEIVAIGCTSRGQAHRLGRWLLYTERMETDTVTFRAGLDAAYLYPGAVIQVQDQFRAGKRYGGRIVSATATSITIDAPVQIEAGKAYQLSVVLPDGTVETRPVSAAVGDQTVLTVSPAFASAPQAQAIWVLAASDLVPTTWRVVSLREVEPTIVEVTALAHRLDKYAAIEQNIVLEPLPVSSLSASAPAAPQNLRVVESLTLIGPGIVGAMATVSWDSVPGAMRYEVSWTAVGQNSGNSESQTSSHDIQPIRPGVYTFAVRAVNALGRRSAASTITQTIYGKTTPPANVTGLQLAALSSHAVLTFDPAPDLDVIVGGSMRIRHSSMMAGATWDTSQDIAAAIPGGATQAVVPLLSGTYLAKWVDSSGNESTSPTLVTTDAPDILGLNVAETWNPVPGWTGTRASVYVAEGGALSLDSAQTIAQQTGNVSTWPKLSLLGGVASAGEYISDTIIDVGRVTTSRLTAQLAVTSFDAADTIGARTDDVSLWPAITGANVNDVTVRVWIATSDDGSTWSAWRPHAVADWTARYYKFRVTIESGSGLHNAYVTACSVTVDMPDLIQEGMNIVSGAGTYTVAFPRPFHTLKALAITAEDMATGDYYQITNRSATAFDITFRDTSGASVSRTFDYIAKGY